MELLTQTERSTTVMAVRDSELAKLPEGLFNNIKLKHSVVMTRLIKLLGERLLGKSSNSITHANEGTWQVWLSSKKHRSYMVMHSKTILLRGELKVQVIKRSSKSSSWGLNQ